MVRLEEMRQSINIVHQCVNKLTSGPIKSWDGGPFFPSRGSARSVMENIIDHFKFFADGVLTSSGSVYYAVESPKGEFGVTLASIGDTRAYRCKVRSPGFFHLQGAKLMAKNVLLSDLVAIIGTIDIVLGEIDR